MPTTKRRISITLPEQMAMYLKKISLRDDVSQASKIITMLEEMLAIEEDGYWNARAEAVERKNKGWLTHQQFWKGLL